MMGRGVTAATPMPGGPLLTFSVARWRSPRGTSAARPCTVVSRTQAFELRQPDRTLVGVADGPGRFADLVEAVEGRVLAYHAGRGDFSRWVRDVFGDPELGARLEEIERGGRRGLVPGLRRTVRSLVPVRGSHGDRRRGP